MTVKPDLLALWSVPRSRSTAFERMMHERGDYLVLHEPFSRVCDFGSVDLLGRTCVSQDEVMSALIDLAADQPVFFKDTTDFRFERLTAHPEFVDRCRHTAMVRNPDDAVRSHLTLQADATSAAMGYGQLWEIVSAVTSLGLPMHLIDGDALAAYPEREVRLFCQAMDIAFLPEALKFRKSPPSTWGVTGRWHLPASESTVLGATPVRKVKLSAQLESLAYTYVQDQMPYYERIRETLAPSPNDRRL